MAEHWQSVPCKIWHKCIDSTTGYGIAWDTQKQKNIGAHRMAYKQAYGQIPEGMYVLHHCDVRACVEPMHLFLGTSADNVHDMLSKGRGKYSKRTHCAQGHPWDENNTYRHPNGQRVCRTCMSKSRREWATRKSNAIGEQQ